jgi:hypothetical protein
MNKEFGSVFFWDKILPLVDKKRAQNPTKDFVEKKNKVAIYQGPKKEVKFVRFRPHQSWM